MQYFSEARDKIFFSSKPEKEQHKHHSTFQSTALLGLTVPSSLIPTKQKATPTASQSLPAR